MSQRRYPCVFVVVLVALLSLSIGTAAVAQSAEEATRESHDGASAPGYQEQVDQFFTTLGAGDAAKALADLYGEDNPRLESNPDELPTMQKQFEAVAEALGEMHERRLMAEELVTDRFVLLWYVVYFDNAPLSYYFKFYKPADEWRFYTVEFKNDLGQIALERAQASAE